MRLLGGPGGDSEVSGRIPDQEVRSAYIELWAAFYRKLPACGFSAQRLQEELAGEGADRRFYEGLSAVQDGVIALWGIVNELVRNLPIPLGGDGSLLPQSSGRGYAVSGRGYAVVVGISRDD